MGNTSVTGTDLWSVVNNISGLAGLQAPACGIYYASYFGIKSLNKYNAAVAIPYRQLWTGINISRYGDENYNESFLGLGLAHKIRNVSLGLKADLFQLQITEEKNIHKVLISFGGQAELSKELSFGAYIYNMSQAKVRKDLEERLPTIMKLGILWKPSSKIVLSAETEKEIRYSINWKAGLEYTPVKGFRIWTGINTFPSRVFFGAGIRKYNFEIAYAAGTMSKAGSTHHLNLNYFFR
ncbi:hypothetical protein Belba_3391 [Sporocytophaga myxococcoides]|uniref:Uncharacterized protein n=2 Tax=Sporocytophaga myxococcoides TaxID=153721 RepID=A0A098LJ11_9BACT|nr:hypothetical protein Belba_3391 [Sporocytophaga myxococcoides]